jgi:hypothetical protein
MVRVQDQAKTSWPSVVRPMTSAFLQTRDALYLKVPSDYLSKVNGVSLDGEDWEHIVGKLKSLEGLEKTLSFLRQPDDSSGVSSCLPVVTPPVTHGEINVWSAKSMGRRLRPQLSRRPRAIGLASLGQPACERGATRE